VAALTDNSTDENSRSLLPHTGEGVVVDIGTGDGRFVYRAARENPRKFYVGIDASRAALEKISMKATRKPAKGGLPNVLFVQAAVEDLPGEFDGAADEIHIHFPWGSLLQAVVLGDEAVLRSLRRISAPGCLLEIVIGIDPVRDKTEIARLGLPSLTEDYLTGELIPKYLAVGFELVDFGTMDAGEWSKFETSWARKLQGGEGRRVIYLLVIARATCKFGFGYFLENLITLFS
jgi:16S rRNA (adenine(1408)-N(1))-methyltransferase